jgi:predicted ATPase
VENERRVTVSSDFGSLLRRHRLAAGLSQQSLAERARMSVDGISALERGYRKTPQFETLTLLAGALTLTEEQRSEFVAAAQPREVRGRSSVTVGPWPSAGSANLPLALTRFIGREAELGEIATLLGEHRFVTLTGAGGVGKTQTALRVASALSDATETSVCFVGLAPMNDPSLVAMATATALGLQEVPNHPVLETLVAFLKNKTLLLVLDNCEHVITQAAIVADFLLHRCPDLRILATSRERLRTGGERTYRLPSLLENDAIALFADRAQAADAHFTLTEKNRTVIGEICAHLSGIPLAIELAAAWATVLPLPALAKALDDRLVVLVDGERTASPRQQTMRAAIDWSYELLPAPEQRLFERLSVFAGGCTINAATAVCRSEDVAGDSVLSLISSLVGKSLVVADLEGDEPRYRLLEPFRDYAREKLKVHREEGTIAQRHLVAYIEDAARFVPRDQHYTVHYGYPHKEIGNWRAAIRWALTERNNVLGGQRLVAEVGCLWGPLDVALNDARRWIPTAFELVDEQTPPDVIAKLRLAQAELATHLDQNALQLASAREAVAYYREAGDALRLVRAQILLAGGNLAFGRMDEGFAIFEDTLSIARNLGSRWDLWRVLRNFGLWLLDRDLVASRTYLMEAYQLLQAADDRVNSVPMAMDFAELAFREGDAESALRHLTDVFAKDRAFVYSYSRRWAVRLRLDIAKCLTRLDRYEEAREHVSDALEAAREAQMDVLIVESVARLARIAVLRKADCASGVQVRAARTMGFVDARLEALGVGASTYHGDQFYETLREALGTEAFANLTAEGASMTENEAVETALAL